MGKKERDKGARGERLLRDYLNSFGVAVKRGYVFLRQSDLVGLQGIHIECKFVERLNVRKAMSQAVEEAEKRRDGLPAVFWKVSRKPWLTIMRTEDFMRLYMMARGKTGGDNDGPTKNVLEEDRGKYKVSKDASNDAGAVLPPGASRG